MQFIASHIFVINYISMNVFTTKLYLSEYVKAVFELLIIFRVNGTPRKLFIWNDTENLLEMLR